MPRIAKAKETAKSSSRQQEEEYTVDLAVDILHTALDCKGVNTLSPDVFNTC